MAIETLDVKNKSLGRAAAETAALLRGKNMPNFAPNKAPEHTVKIINLDKIKFSEQKKSQKAYKYYSGYPGGLKYTPAEKKNLDDIFRKAVWGMLPKNKLRKPMIKNLIIEK